MRKLLRAVTGRELMEPEEQEERQHEDGEAFLLHAGDCCFFPLKPHIPRNDC